MRNCETKCNHFDTHCREAGSVLQYGFAHNVRGVRPFSLTCCGGTRHENAKCESVDCEGGIHFQHRIPSIYHRCGKVSYAVCASLGKWVWCVEVRVWCNICFDKFVVVCTLGSKELLFWQSWGLIPNYCILGGFQYTIVGDLGPNSAQIVAN